MRALAAFAVLLQHAHASTWATWSSLPEASRTPSAKSLYMLQRFGYDAVVVFFVISGYLVGGKLLERAAAQRFEMSSYAIDRITRVYVPYVPALCLTLGVSGFLGEPLGLRTLAGNLFQLQGILVPACAGNGPLWTLSYETWFYILGGLAAATWTLPASSRPICFILMAAAVSVFSVLFPIFLMCWLIGAFAYRLGASSNPSRDLLVGCSLLVLGLVARQLSPWVAFNKPGAETQLASLAMCAGLGLILSVAAFWQPAGIWSKIERMGVWCAASSYTLYLTHSPVLRLLEHAAPGRAQEITASSMAYYVGKILICLAVAWVLYLPFEKQTPRVRAWVRGLYARLTRRTQRAS